MSGQTRTRLLALVGASEGNGNPAPPAADALDTAHRLPGADVLLLIAGAEPDAMIFRYTAYGELGGDSWHLTVAEAQEQAGEEYGEALLPWEPVPDDIADAHAYAINFAADRLNDRGRW